MQFAINRRTHRYAVFADLTHLQTPASGRGLVAMPLSQKKGKDELPNLSTHKSTQLKIKK